MVDLVRAGRNPDDLAREWSGRLAQTRGQDRQDYVQHGRGRPSVGETPANTVDVFLASAAPLARDSGCPPNRGNPTWLDQWRGTWLCIIDERAAKHNIRPCSNWNRSRTVSNAH